MKKNKIIYVISTLLFSLCLLISYFSFPSFASTTGTVSLTESKGLLETGEEVEITLQIKDSKTAAFTANLYFDDTKVDFVSGPENINVIDNRIIFVWYDTTGGKSPKEGKLATFKFKAKEDGLANFTVNGDFYSPAGQLIQTDFKEDQVQIGREESELLKQVGEEQGTSEQNSNANLQALRINLEGLVPNFEKDIYEYDLTIAKEINEIEIVPITENPNATATVTGNTNLKEGLNIITIDVTSQDQSKKNTYTIRVTKTADLEQANTNLETLAIENTLLNPPFDNSQTHYTAEVSNTITDLNILAIPENENATAKVSGKENLKEGDNTVSILVTAPNGFTTRQYTIKVYKRNAEEEKRYQEEQSKQENKLEEAYKIEQTLAKEDKTNQGEDANKESNNIAWIITIIIIILILALGFFIYQKRKNNKKKDSKEVDEKNKK